MNYARIARAIEFYKSIGYTYIDVPWVADYESVNKTAPTGARLFPLHYQTNEVHHPNDSRQPRTPYLVASAEQSFLMLAKQGKLNSNHHYVACTPCFRAEEKLDEFHQFTFLKVELFCLNRFAWDVIMDDARRFFRSELDDNIDISYRTVDNQCRDWYLNGIEIGSYYSRSDYSCGTGLAEPRFTKAMKHAT